MLCRCIYRHGGLTLHCTPTLQTPSADLSFQTSIAYLHCTPPLQTPGAHITLQTYFVDLLCRVTILSLLWPFGGVRAMYNPFLCPGLLGGSGPQCFPLPWPFGGVRATILSSALALSGGGGLYTRDACTCTHSLHKEIVPLPSDFVFVLLHPEKEHSVMILY